MKKQSSHSAIIYTPDPGPETLFFFKGGLSAKSVLCLERGLEQVVCVALHAINLANQVREIQTTSVLNLVSTLPRERC